MSHPSGLSLIVTIIICAAGSYGFVVVDKLVTLQILKVEGYLGDLKSAADLSAAKAEAAVDAMANLGEEFDVADRVADLLVAHSDVSVSSDFANATTALILDELEAAMESYEEAFEYAFDLVDLVLKFFEKCSKFVMPSMYMASHLTFATACYSLFTFHERFREKTLEFRATGGLVDGEPLLTGADSMGGLILVRASKGVSLVGLLCSNTMILCLTMLLTTLAGAFGVQLALSFDLVPRVSLRYVWTQAGIWVTGTFLEAVIIDGILTESAHVLHHAAFDFFDFLFCYWNVVYGYVQGPVRRGRRRFFFSRGGPDQT